MATKLVPLALILSSLLALAVSLQPNLPTFTCNGDINRLDADNGYLSLTRNVSKCQFITKDNAEPFAIRTDNLQLRAGDSIVIETIADGSKHTLEPPFDSGFLFVGIKEPKIIFNFNGSLDNTSTLVEFFQDTNLSINADINNNFQITPVQIDTLNLAFKRTIPDLVHLEVAGGHFANTTSRHLLMATDTIEIPIAVEGAQSVHVKTSPALKDCSNDFTDTSEKSHDISGPDATKLNRRYKCVNLFNAQIQGQAHYDVDFANFSDVVDVDDYLVIEDGVSKSRMEVEKLKAREYAGQKFSFQGDTLAVIYESPRVVQPNQGQFKLTVSAEATGGVVSQPGDLKFTDAEQIRYVLEPKLGQYAAIQIKSGAKLQGITLEVSKAGQRLATLSGINLPPVIAIDEVDVPMTLVVTGKKLSSLNGAIQFSSLQTNCHRITSPPFSSFSVVGPNGPCHWTVTSDSGDNVNLKFDYHDLLPGGCITIQPLDQAGPIFYECDIGRFDALPTFVTGQAYITVDLKANDTRLDASLSTVPSSGLYKLKLKPQFNIVGSYVLSSNDQIYSLNATNKNYILSVDEVEGKLSIDKLEVSNKNRLIVGDIDASGKVTNITVRRSSEPNGFKVTATQFDKIIVADPSKTKLVAPKSANSTYIKISSSSKRIQFNITLTGDHTDGYKLSVFDSRTLLGRVMEFGDKKPYGGSSTSDTLLVAYQPIKPNATLPELTIEYGFVNCNLTVDHVCDNSTRCIPTDLLCKGSQYCFDGTDSKLPCSSGPVRPIVETGVGSMTVFILCVLMLTLGAVFAIYGPNFIKVVESRFRGGHYTTFTSSE